MSDERRAIMRIPLDLLHDMLLLPDTVTLEAVHVGVDDFQRELLSIRLGGKGLPTAAAKPNEPLPAVCAHYHITPKGPVFLRFLEVPESVPIDAVELNEMRFDVPGREKR